jgi:hypothetical protein
VPYRNRVTPFGHIVATPARGLLFGNRGVLHDRDRRLVREWQVRRWITCLLSFRGRHREVMPPGHYTGLFFLDEATSFAAGHRPCAECRHADYQAFRAAWMSSHGGGLVRADDMDRVLHAERLDPTTRSKRTHRARLASLPDGVMLAQGDEAWLVFGDRLLRWTPFGYDAVRERPSRGTFPVLTPPSTVAVIRAGYRPDVHPTAPIEG